MSFESFMRAALFDPQHGYYSRQILTVGAKGDFATATTLSSTLARAIGDWVMTQHRTKNLPLNLIEIGAGDGSLARHLLKSLPLWTRLKCKYHIVETSAPLRQQQAKRLSRKVRWFDSPKDALTSCGGEAIIFHNELVDAFPVRRFEKKEEGWEECWIELGSQGKREYTCPSSPLPASSAFDQGYQTGQRIEVLESYQTWLKEWLPDWKRGEMLTIDYGDPIERLYHRRPKGTLRAYLFHQTLSGMDIYQNPGRQDMTSDVNFTDLANWGNSLGLQNAPLQTQADFIRKFASDSLEDQYLLDESGPGKEFKVLHQSKR